MKRVEEKTKEELLIRERNKLQNAGRQSDYLENELQQIERQLKTINRDQEQLLQWALKGFPEDTIVAENKRINDKRNLLQNRKSELKSQIATAKNTEVNLPKIEAFIQTIRDKIANLDFDMKRLALDMLDIKAWIDGENIVITGCIPITDDVITTKYSRRLIVVQG